MSIRRPVSSTLFLFFSFLKSSWKKSVYDYYTYIEDPITSNFGSNDLIDKDLGGTLSDTHPYFKKSNYISWLFSVKEGEETTFNREQLLEYLYSYDKSYFNGQNYRGLSMDLLNGVVDEGHTQGYNNKSISADDVYSF